jgi:hypothetical protein
MQATSRAYTLGMQLNAGDRRWLWGLLLLAGSALAVLLLGAVWFAARYQDAADYPGAARVAGQNIYKFSPNLTIRRDTAYRTADPFPTVYNYYSAGFELGPESYAQSNCIQMSDAVTELHVLQRTMAVTVCDTRSGRMIFVMRSLSLRLTP